MRECRDDPPARNDSADGTSIAWSAHGVRSAGGARPRHHRVGGLVRPDRPATHLDLRRDHASTCAVTANPGAQSRYDLGAMAGDVVAVIAAGGRRAPAPRRTLTRWGGRDRGRLGARRGERRRHRPVAPARLVQGAAGGRRVDAARSRSVPVRRRCDVRDDDGRQARGRRSCPDRTVCATPTTT